MPPKIIEKDGVRFMVDENTDENDIDFDSMIGNNIPEPNKPSSLYESNVSPQTPGTSQKSVVVVNGSQYEGDLVEFVLVYNKLTGKTEIRLVLNT